MSYALIHGIDLYDETKQPLNITGVNTENSFYTDCPAITACAGFVNALSELCNIKVKGFAFFIHNYNRNIGKCAFNSPSIKNSGIEDKMVNPPVPLELFTANMQCSIVIEYDQSLPDDLDSKINAKTNRFNGGFIVNDVMISEIDDLSLSEYFTQYHANQVIDCSYLNITTWAEMLEYIAFYRNDVTNRFIDRKHDRIYYSHQVGYQLLNTPIVKGGALLKNNKVCKHAYCEPVINLARLESTRLLKPLSEFQLWNWNTDLNTQTITLTMQKGSN